MRLVYASAAALSAIANFTMVIISYYWDHSQFISWLRVFKIFSDRQTIIFSCVAFAMIGIIMRDMIAYKLLSLGRVDVRMMDIVVGLEGGSNQPNTPISLKTRAFLLYPMMALFVMSGWISFMRLP